MQFLKACSINCGAAVLITVSMVNHGFYNGNKVRNLKDAILNKILVQMSLYYTQIEENTNFWGVGFLTFSWILVFLWENQDLIF